MHSLDHSYRGKSVLVTGHTGFKGGWLALWLHQLGAKVHGFALPPSTADNLFETAQVARALSSDIRGNINDLTQLQAAFAATQPEVVFHLAAQPLVRESYRNPLGTFSTNIMGTAHMLEAARATPSVRAMVMITTDKVYENREWEYPYRETDPLGGHDPYSASKAASEIVISSYRASFFGDATKHPALIASARAGNVIGGGDWSPDRLVPDCLKAFQLGQPVRLRYPHAVRPWQHVLEPLSGYLQLGAALSSENGNDFTKAWNFGPDITGDQTVGQIAQTIAAQWGPEAEIICDSVPPALHEAGLLRLDSIRARQNLGWCPRWSVSQALEHTVRWHEAWLRREDMHLHTCSEINEYQSLLST